jgi:uncharacterized protein DUF3106
VLKIRSIAILALAAFVLAVAGEPRALAQRQDKDRQEKWGDRERMKGPGPHRGEWLRKNQNLPPAEQERALRNDPTFRQLAPERQEQLLDRLRNFNSRPPEQRQRILNRMETFEHLPAPERQRVRNLYGQMRDLPEDRRIAVHQAARQLGGMSPAERQRMMNSPQFRRRFSPQEQDLVRGLAQLEPGQR